MTAGPEIDGWFSTPTLVALDSARVGVVIGSLALLYLLTQAVWAARTNAQRAMLVGLGGYVGMGVGWEVDRLGDLLSYGLAFQAVSLTAALWGCYRYVYGYPPTPLPPTVRRPSPLRRRRR